MEKYIPTFIFLLFVALLIYALVINHQQTSRYIERCEEVMSLVNNQ